jgi:transposase
MCKEISVASVAGIVSIHENSVWRILGHYADKAKEQREYLAKWHYWETHNNIPGIISVSKAINKHAQGVLEAMKNELNSGIAKELSNNVKTAFKRSYCLKKEKYRNTMIYLTAGKLTLSI